MAADEFLAEEGARVEAWLGGLLTRGLCLPDGLSVDQRSRELDAARAAAGELAGAHWGHGEAGIEARVQAAQFVAAHAAAMDWQAEANRRDLPNHARAIAQRLARQLMALTTAQLGALCRLKAERRKEREETARLAAKQTATQATSRTADRQDLSARGVPAACAAPQEPRSAQGSPAGTEAPAATPVGPPAKARPEPVPGAAEGITAASGAGVRAKPEPVSAGVPAPPPEPAPPLNRRERRALERLRRRERQRERLGSGLDVAAGPASEPALG